MSIEALKQAVDEARRERPEPTYTLDPKRRLDEDFCPHSWLTVTATDGSYTYCRRCLKERP